MRTYAEVREFCIRKLAHILYECVACYDVERAKLDWLTAEQFVDANKPAMDGLYDCFQAATAPPLGQIQDFQTFDRLCSLAIWDMMYQPLKEKLNLPYGPIPHYTYIRYS